MCVCVFFPVPSASLVPKAVRNLPRDSSCFVGLMGPFYFMLLSICSVLLFAQRHTDGTEDLRHRRRANIYVASGENRQSRTLPELQSSGLIAG